MLNLCRHLNFGLFSAVQQKKMGLTPRKILPPKTGEYNWKAALSQVYIRTCTAGNGEILHTLLLSKSHTDMEKTWCAKHVLGKCMKDLCRISCSDIDNEEDKGANAKDKEESHCSNNEQLMKC